MSESYTAEQWMKQWLLHQEKKKLRKVSIGSYRNIVCRYLTPAFQNMPLTELTTEKIQAVYDDWQKNGMPANTLYTIHLVCRRCLQTACNEGILQENPARNCVLYPNKENQTGHLPTEKEYYRYLRTISGMNEYPLLYTALTTSLPQSKILALRWADFDIAHRQLIVGKRIYPLDRKCIELLKRQAQISGQGELIFPYPKTGKKYTKSQFYYLHHKVLQKAELPKNSFSIEKAVSNYTPIPHRQPLGNCIKNTKNNNLKPFPARITISVKPLGRASLFLAEFFYLVTPPVDLLLFSARRILPRQAVLCSGYSDCVV